MSQETWNKLKIRSSKLMNSLFLWNFKAAFHGKWIEFQDFREYTQNDDAKYIDWLTSSREGTTIMRRYREEKQGNILCSVDVTSSLFFQKEKKQVIIELINLLHRATLSSGESFGWYIIDSKGNQYIPPKKTHIPLYKLLQFSSHPRRIDTLLNIDFLARPLQKRSVVFIISDSLEVDRKSFKVVSEKHDIIYIHISSVFENTLEGIGLTELRWQDHCLGIDLDNWELRQKYIEARKTSMMNFSQELKSIWIDSVFLDESKSLLSELLKLMDRRK